jgi:hypothetical protein
VRSDSAQGHQGWWVTVQQEGKTVVSQYSLYLSTRHISSICEVVKACMSQIRVKEMKC